MVWGSEDIQLIADKPSRTHVSHWQTFITKPLNPLSTNNQAHIGPLQYSGVSSDELYPLAFLLLELAFNVPLRDKRTAQDIENAGQSEASINYHTAGRLTGYDLLYEMGPEYADVVRRCLHGLDAVDLDSYDWNSERCHQTLWAEVIKPVEKDLSLRAPPGWQSQC